MLFNYANQIENWREKVTGIHGRKSPSKERCENMVNPVGEREKIIITSGAGLWGPFRCALYSHVFKANIYQKYLQSNQVKGNKGAKIGSNPLFLSIFLCSNFLWQIASLTAPDTHQSLREKVWPDEVR